MEQRKRMKIPESLCALYALFAKKRLSALVLGFYDRGNLGDEQYKQTMPVWCGSKMKLTFKSIDDAVPVKSSSEYDVIICGGGDIINRYFMEKVKVVVAAFNGPIYAVSVGIPYDDDKAYLDLFDHVFVRSRYDEALAIAQLGARNVTYTPDLAFLVLPSPRRSDQLNIGICLATPVLIAYPAMMPEMAMFVRSMLNTKDKHVTVHFLSFNTFNNNDNESDVVSAKQIMAMLTPTEQRFCIVHLLKSAKSTLDIMAKMTVNVCMRYHSIIFSTKACVPFIAVHSTKKAKMLLADMSYPTKYQIDLRSESIDRFTLSTLLRTRVQDPTTPSPPSPPSPPPQLQSNQVRSLVMPDSATGAIKPTTLAGAVQNASKLLDAYFGYHFTTPALLGRTGALNIGLKDPLQVARVLCYAITSDIEDDCIWGLAENMLRPDFNLLSAIRYIFSNGATANSTTSTNNTNSDTQYYPELCIQGSDRVFVSIDPLSHTQPMKGLHRSGWSFVLGHMMNMDGARFLRPHRLMVDTYVDRTFHWGQEAMMLTGALPYRSQWVGFIHHTFDTTHSDHNCSNMFDNNVFKQSLTCCKGLIVLSKYLAAQVTDAIQRRHLPNIPVHVLYHPTEFVTRGSMFTYKKFLANPNKKVVQIGAWLRNPYAIYSLPLYDDILNPLGIRKAVLKGKQMDGYYLPQATNLADIISPTTATPPATEYTCDFSCRSTAIVNKYIVGLRDTIQANHDSVEMINSLNNQAYDALLSQNIVFLNLVDCSAVNTVIECTVRNTIIVVNRHPAIIEILGKSYPGFYDTPIEAALILGDPKRLQKCYKHLVGLDKTMLKIETFMTSFARILSNI